MSNQANVDIVIRAQNQTQGAVEGAAGSLDKLTTSEIRAAQAGERISTTLDKMRQSSDAAKNRLMGLAALEPVTKGLERARVEVERLRQAEIDTAASAKAMAEAQLQAAQNLEIGRRKLGAAKGQVDILKPYNVTQSQVDQTVARLAEMHKRIATMQKPSADPNFIGTTKDQEAAREYRNLQGQIESTTRLVARMQANLGTPNQVRYERLVSELKKAEDQYARLGTAAERAAERATKAQDKAASTAQNFQRAIGAQASYEGMASPLAKSLNVNARLGDVQNARVDALAGMGLGGNAGNDAVRQIRARANAEAEVQATIARAGQAKPDLDIGQRTLGGYDALINKVLGLVAAYVSLQGAVSAITSVVQAYRTIEAAQNRLGALFNQNKEAVGKEMEYLARTSDKLGLSFKVLADNYGSLALAAKSAGLRTEETRELFEALSVTSRVNKFTSDQMNSAFLAIQQMMSKGKIQAQELTLQLGNVLPGAYSTVARALGKTTAELGEMMQNGDLMANAENMGKIAKELIKTYGAQLPESLTTFTTAMDRANNNLFRAKTIIAEGGLIEALKRLFEAFNSFSGTKEGNDFLLSIGAAAGKAVDGITFLIKHANELRMVLMAVAAAFIGRTIAAWGAQLVTVASQAGGFVAAMAGPTASIAYLKGAAANLTVALNPLRAALSAVNGVVYQQSVAFRIGGLSALAYNAGMGVLRAGATVLAGTLGLVTAAARTLLAAFGGIPGILATVAIYFAGDYFAKWLGHVDDTTAALEEHKRVMGQVISAYEGAKDKAGDWAKSVQGVSYFQAESNWRAQQEAVKKVQGQIAELATGTTSYFETAKTAFGLNPVNQDFAKGLVQLSKDVVTGKISVDEYDKKLNDLFATTKDPALVELLRKFIPLSEQLKIAQKQASAAADATLKMGTAAGTANLPVKELKDEIAKTGETVEKAAKGMQAFADSTYDAAKNAKALQEALNKQRADVPELKPAATRDTSLQTAQDNAKSTITLAENQSKERIRQLQDEITKATAAGDTAMVNDLQKEILGETQKLANTIAEANKVLAQSVKAANDQFVKDTVSYQKGETSNREEKIARIIRAESNNNPSAANGDALGLGQFVKSTWINLIRDYKPEIYKQYADENGKLNDREGLLKLRLDPELSKEIVGIYVDQIDRTLKSKGIPTTNANTYTSYFGGEGVGPKITRQAAIDPSVQVSQFYSADALEKNKWVIGKTVGEFMELMEKKMALGQRIKTGSGDDYGMTDEEVKAKKDKEKLDKRIEKQQQTANDQLDQTTYDKSQAELRKSNNIEDHKTAFINDRVRSAESNDPVDRSQLTPEQIKALDESLAKVKEIAAAEYEVNQRREDGKTILNRQMEALRGLSEKQKELRDEAKVARENDGDNEKYTRLKKQADDLTPSIKAAADEARRLAGAVGDDKALANIDAMVRKTRDLKDGMITAKQGTDLFVSSGTTAFSGITEHLGKAIAGTEKWSTAWKGMRNAALGFFTSILKGFADMIAKAALLKLANSLGIGGIFANLANGAVSGGVSLGTAHGGFDFDSGTRLGPSIGPKVVDPAIFHEATRYHSGKSFNSMSPLAPGELPAIIRDDETVLTKPQMGKVGDMINNSRAMAGSMAAMAANPPSADVKVVQVSNPTDMLREAIKDREGQQVVFDFVGEKAGVWRQRMGVNR